MPKINKKLQGIIKAHNLGQIVRYFRHTSKCDILIVKKNGINYFIKIAVNPETYDNLINEVKANQFITRLKPKALPLRIPKSKIIITKNYVLGIFEYISAAQFADQDKLKILIKLTQSDMEKLFQIEAFFLKIPKTKMPNYFIKKSEKLFTFDKCVKKMNEYSARPMNKLITPLEQAKLIENIKEIGFRKCYQHQDFVLWNILKDNSGKIVLTDAEFARWGMKWMDIAYFFIQTYITLQNPDLAKQMLNYFINRFNQDFPKANIEKEIMAPLNFRITANLNEALGKKKLEKLAKQLLEKILTNDIQKVIS